jgi:hypothetical protein
MALYQIPTQPESGAEHLASEARKRLTELSDTTFWAYTQLENYEKNNTQGVKPAAFLKALGGDQKDYVAIKRAMKRLLIKINPEFKDRLAALTQNTAKPTP